MSKFYLRSKRVVTPEGIHDAAIVVDEGKIKEVRDFNDVPTGEPVDDVGLAVLMPGLVDTHVHINEPGRTEWEGFETATKAAAAGGITTLIDMPLNSSPVTTTVDAFQIKLDAANGKLWVDCGFYGGVIPGNTSEIQPLIDAGVLGFKAFLIHAGLDEFPNSSEGGLRSAMPIIAENKVPLLAHCELQSSSIDLDESSRRATLHHSDPRLYRGYLASRPPNWEQNAIDLMIRLCREFNCPTHIVHLSSADAIATLKEARADGLPLTVETCPHYLYFIAEEIPDCDTRFKCAPPIRERENRERLWDGLKNGDIDFIVSDHSPSTPELKYLPTGDFSKAWGGVASLQFGLSIVWTEARRRGFTVEDLARWMCARPARLVGLEKKKGSIAPGFDADIVVWNPDASFVVEPSMIHHRHKLTPYEGRTLQGVVERTYLRGKKIYDKGAFDAKPNGQVLLKKEVK